MNGRQPSVRAVADKDAEREQARARGQQQGAQYGRGGGQGASLAELARQGGMRALGVLSEEGRTRSEPVGVSTGVEGAGTGSMTKAQARVRRAELAAELAALEGVASSPGGPSDSSSPARPPQGRIYHPRAVSAGHPPSLSAGGGGGRTPPSAHRSASPVRGSPAPRDPVAARIERSFVGGYDFEEVSREEAGEWPAVRAVAMEPPPEGRRQSAGGSWWGWGRKEEGAAGEVEGEGKKDA